MIFRYGNLTASDDEVEEAARMARVLEFSRGFPLGLDTEVGARGYVIVLIILSIIWSIIYQTLTQPTNATNVHSKITIYYVLTPQQCILLFHLLWSLSFRVIAVCFFVFMCLSLFISLNTRIIFLFFLELSGLSWVVDKSKEWLLLVSYWKIHRSLCLTKRRRRWTQYVY